MNFNSKRYYGLQGGSPAWLIGNITKKISQTLVICQDQKTLEQYYDDLSVFTPAGHNLVLFPPTELLPFEQVAPQVDSAAARLSALYKLTQNKRSIILTCPEAIIQKVIPQEVLTSLIIELKSGAQFEREKLIERLVTAGYKRVTLVEEIGNFAVRGGVIDVYTTLYKDPIRIEFIGNVIESIKTFNLESQRSFETFQSCQVIPISPFSGTIVTDAADELLANALESIKEMSKDLQVPLREVARLENALRSNDYLPGLEQFIGMIYPGATTLFSYLSNDCSVVMNDEVEIYRELDRYFEIVLEREERFHSEHRLIPELYSVYSSPEEFQRFIQENDPISIDRLEHLQESEATKIVTFGTTHLKSILSSKAESGKALAELTQQINTWRNQSNSVAFVAHSESRANRLQKLLLERNLNAEILNLNGLDWIDKRKKHPLAILIGNLHRGFQLPAENLVIISDNEIFSERTSRTHSTHSRSIKRFLSSISQLKEEDYVVHIDYGVGIYHGLKHIKIEGKGRDFLHLEYAGGTKLYLPVENIGKIQKFIAKEGQTPTLDKLGSKQWQSKKAKVRQAVVSLAGELIKLYAARQSAKGWRFEPAGAEDERFADGFGFEETPDQQTAIDQTLADMAKEQPMDRLVCGDAGYGKTEVALRAAFKCIQHGRQVAVLVPTTILVEQHHSVFSERFLEYPVKVAALSRFYKPKSNSETIKRIASGDVDIVIGTHKLLQSSIEFKDLGLVIVDEEHRFGVKHKERLKQIKKNVDVLTLTATPIPRTLHMALLGIREISIISTPPHDRKTIRTYVATHDEYLIRDAILREIQRGGQVYYLHNRVQNIQFIKETLTTLVPEARIEAAHGQMKEAELENIIMKFLKREIDVLVCTTIVESGIDIPNANTMIINRADMLGLAQLYQLRGRVGRSDRQAYAYLLVPEMKKLGVDARKRLKVLQSLDDLGLGFHLATRDLEIRGAGNLLGKDQSGNVQSVGLELYNKILKEAVLHLRGEEPELVDTIDPELKIAVNAFLPADYVPDISQRLILYQRLADLRSEEEVYDLNNEIEDRFGRIPEEAKNLISLMELRSILKQTGILLAEFGNGILALQFSPKAKIDAERLFKLVKEQPNKFSLKGKLTVTIKTEFEQIENPRELMEPIRNLLTIVSNQF